MSNLAGQEETNAAAKWNSKPANAVTGMANVLRFVLRVHGYAQILSVDARAFQERTSESTCRSLASKP